jgi:hypothetical protein
VIAVRDPAPYAFRARVLAVWTTERGGEATTAVADCRPEDAEHIAGAHPGVALAFADLLDGIADEMDRTSAWIYHDAGRRRALVIGGSLLERPDWTAALATARTVLGTDPTPTTGRD